MAMGVASERKMKSARYDKMQQRLKRHGVSGPSLHGMKSSEASRYQERFDKQEGD
jgi:hypothetical protein